MTHCLHCGVTNSNGLALCELCRYKAARIFEMLPVYIRNLSRQRRPGRPNGSLGVSGQWLIRRGETEGSKINAALDRAFNDLDTWAECLSNDRGVEMPKADTDAETAVALCAVLEEHLTSIATLEWAGEFVRQIAKHEQALCQLTLTAVPGWYAGTCRQVTGRTMEGDVFVCGADTFVVPGMTWVTCAGCGVTTYARDHLDVILDEARPWVAAPMRLAEAIVALVDTEASTVRLHERIKKWGQREHIDTFRRLDDEGDEVGPRRYRLGDVMDRLAVEGETRPEREDVRFVGNVG